MFLAFEGLFGKGVIFHFVTPIEPLVQKLVHNIYIEWKSPTIFAKFMMWGEATQVSLHLDSESFVTFSVILRLIVLGRSSIIIDNQSFTSLILINRLQNWQSIIGKGDT